MHDALRPDIHPPSGSHLTVIGNAHLHGSVPVLLVIVQPHHHRIRYNDTRRFGLRLEQSQRVSAFDNECLVTGKDFEVLLYQAVLHPVLAYLPRFAIGDELVGIEGDIETEVIVYHHLKGFALDATSFVLVNGLRLEVALRTITVTVNASACAEFFHKLGSKRLVQFFRDVAQSILQCRSRLRGVEGVATVGRPPDTFYEGGIRGQCLA